MFKNNTYLFIVLCFGLLFTACQKEESEFIDQTGQQNEVITSSSSLSNLLIEMSQNPGSYDNIIDGNSCSAVKYPITVMVNGQEIVLTSQEDISLIYAIFDEFPNDQDTLVIVFPITVILNDFSEVVLEDQEDLEELIESCQEESGIACVDFEYPITLFTYNTNEEQTGTLIIESDQELYLLFYGLEEEDIISIDFPITAILEDGTTVEVDSNQELEHILENANCDDDFDDHDDDLEGDFVEDLTSDTWYITYYFDDLDETDDFNGFSFSFATDHTAEAADNNNTVSGSWALIQGDTAKLSLSFGTTDPFGKLEEDWEIMAASSDKIQLRIIDSDGSVNYLTFERNPNAEGSNEAVNALISKLITGSWHVSLFKEEGENLTADYATYNYSFQANSTVTATGSANTINGFWTVEEEGGQLKLILNFNTDLNENFEGLNDDWIVLEATQNLVRLSESGEANESGLLTFEKN